MLPYYYYYDYSTSPFIFDLNCTGTEETILDCPYIESAGSYSCSSYYDAALICQSMWIPIVHQPLIFISSSFTEDNATNAIGYNCSDGDVRLIGGNNDAEGRVEMCYNNFWGQVCHNSWSTNDAGVLCKQLGYQSAGTVKLLIIISL